MKNIKINILLNTDGNFRERYFKEKRISFPPNIERLNNKKYIYQI